MRPSSHARGYDAGHREFRRLVLLRDPVCVIPGCGRPSLHADHHPHTRAVLIQLRMNPNDPRNGRGLCHSCHSRATATHDGGFGNGKRPTQRRPPEAHPGTA